MTSKTKQKKTASFNALVKAINEGIESGTVENFNPHKHLEFLKNQKGNIHTKVSF
jgi:hypothetical protein